MFELVEYAQSDLPTADDALRNALKFTESIESSWTEKANFDGVQTYTAWVNGDYWTARVSTHSDLSYEEMHATVCKDHTKNEAEYIGMVQSFRELEVSGDWESYLVHYKFPFPLRDRDMIIWIKAAETKIGSQFVVVSLPREYDSQNVKAVYASIEVVTRLNGGGVKWLMCTTSDAGGWVPQFLQRPQMPKAVAEDIPQFKRWLFALKKTRPGFLPTS